jgi:YcxB-like protein
MVLWEQVSMTIEYALTRTEIVQGFFRSLASSPKYLLTILLYALTMSGIVLVSRGAFSRSLTLTDAISAALAAGGFFIFLPAMLFIRGKTTRRSLTASSEGMSTEIGSLKGQISWRKVKVIVGTDRYVLVSCANGNAFFIPSRAFSSPEYQAEFVAKIQGWATLPAANQNHSV